MQITCPSCYARFHLETSLTDEAARELMATLANEPKEVSRAVVTYLSLFRSKSRALQWDRAKRLVSEVMAITADRSLLVHALNETVTTLREKQAQGNWKPLTNHNYLKRVVENSTGYQALTLEANVITGASSKTMSGIEKLLGKKR